MVRVALMSRLPADATWLKAALDADRELVFAGGHESAVDLLSCMGRDALLSSRPPDVLVARVDAGARRSGVRASRGRDREAEVAPILGLYPQMACLMLVCRREERRAVPGIVSGAAGVLHDDAGAPLVRRALRAAAASEAVPDSAITRSDACQGAGDEVRGRLHDQLLEAFSRLSAQELELASSVANGIPTADIAEGLGCGIASARVRVNALLSRMRVRTRAQLAIAWYRAGLG